MVKEGKELLQKILWRVGKVMVKSSIMGKSSTNNDVENIYYYIKKGE